MRQRELSDELSRLKVSHFRTNEYWYLSICPNKHKEFKTNKEVEAFIEGVEFGKRAIFSTEEESDV